MINFIGKLSISLLAVVGVESILLGFLPIFGIGDGHGADGLLEFFTAYAIISLLLAPTAFYLTWKRL